MLSRSSPVKPPHSARALDSGQSTGNDAIVDKIDAFGPFILTDGLVLIESVPSKREAKIVASRLPMHRFDQVAQVASPPRALLFMPNYCATSCSCGIRAHVHFCILSLRLIGDTKRCTPIPGQANKGI